MSVTIKFRRGSSSEWITSGSTILSSGEPGFEFDTGRFKIGNGVTAWSGLAYASIVPSGFLSGSGINISFGTNGSTATISVSGLNSTYISDFNEAVDDRIGSGLFAAGTGIDLNYNDSGNSFTVSVTGLISNPNNNRLLTSRDNTTTGIDAESNLTFDGTMLTVAGDAQANYFFGNIDGPIVYDCRNNTGSTINIGTPVYISGHYANGKVDIAPADASNSAKMPALGLLGSTLTTGQEGYVHLFGALSNIDTSIYSDPTDVGKTLFVGSGGGLTLTRPTGENLLIQNIARIARISNNNGRLLVLGPARTNDVPNSITAYKLNIDNISIDGNTISSTNTNGNITIQPTGNGGLQANNAGNARGSYSIDWQLSRSSGDQVASATYSTIGGGRDNKTSGSDSVIAGGRANYAASIYGAICGGASNYAGLASSICGGIGNSGLSSYNFIGGGAYNSVSGDYSSILGGTNNNDGGYNNVFILGSNITATQTDTTYVQNLKVSSTGDLSTLKFSSIDISSLPVGTGISNSGVLIFVEPTGVVTTYKITGSGLRSSLLDQPAVLRFRQGTDAERVLVTFASGEPVWTTDTKKFYIGDGVTAGGTAINPSSGVFTSIEVDNLKLDGNTFSSTSGVIIISPSGSQAIQASSGGNARGGYAVDLQRVRASGNQVAAGTYDVILNGQNNASSGSYNTTLNGYGNNIFAIAGLYSEHCVIGGENNNIRNAKYSLAFGKNNTLYGDNAAYGWIYNHIIFGEQNTINLSTISPIPVAGNIVAGCANTLSGYYGNCNAVFGGSPFYFGFTGGNSLTNSSYNLVAGDDNTLDDTDYSLVVGKSNSVSAGNNHNVVCGYSNIANGTVSNVFGYDNATYSNYTSILGGSLNIASGDYSAIIAGTTAKTRLRGEISHSAGGFSNVTGSSQHSVLIARRGTTDGTANVVLTLDGNTAGSTNRLVLPAKTTWTFTIILSAYNDSDSAAAGWIFRGCIRRNGANGTALVGSIIEENWKDSAMTSTSASVVADDTNEALEIRVTGIASKNIRWSAVVDLSQVSYGTP